jgi:hypothetical protein
MAAMSGQWILDAKGVGIPTDFINVYGAGRLALEGQAALAYDWDTHKHMQTLVLGQDLDGYFGWHYPPPFLFVAVLLAKLPYTAAFAAWAVLSFIPYLLVIPALVAHRAGWMLAVAFPAVLTNAMIGQNGCLTAALIGGTLYLLLKRPLLFPLVLIAGGHWKTFASASITALILAAGSWLAFGMETWTAFFHWLPRASQAFLSDGLAEFGKMQSVLSFIRFIGGGDRVAWAGQGMVTGAVALALVALWRSRVAFEVKAAALASATLLATPYLYLYDMVVLSIPMALLLRIGMTTGFRAGELPALGCATALLASFPFVVAPVGLAATLVVAGLTARRAGCWWFPGVGGEPASQRRPASAWPHAKSPFVPGERTEPRFFPSGKCE